jgi:S1-C subfamily serine protease
MRLRLLATATLLLFGSAAIQAQTPSVNRAPQAKAQRNVIIIKENGRTIIERSSENGVEVIDRANLAELKELENVKALCSVAYSSHRNPCSPFIGVGTEQDSESGGLVVDYTVDNTPATKYGVLAGDVILAIDGVPVKSQSELVRQRDTHKAGDAFTLTIVRNGAKSTMNLRFKECSQEELDRQAEQEKSFMTMIPSQDNKRPILGIYEADGSNAQGLVVSEVIAGKGAAAAGLKPGDVITTVDGKSISGTTTLRTALSSHKPGDAVTVVYQRNGQTQTTEVKLSGASGNVYTYNYSSGIPRDPCVVFIGVYTADGGVDGKGVRVVGVIDDTPAKVSNVHPGDVILQLDGQPVNTHLELRAERDKHKPGDKFLLTVLRDGAIQNIEATFKACPKSGDLTQPAREVVELLPEDQRRPGDEIRTKSTESILPVVEFEAYPNPTFGLVNVRFEAEPVPTTVRFLDAAGKMVYENRMDNFNGYFSEQIDLSGKTPGTYTLTIQQGNQMVSKNIVLMPRA